MIKKMRIIGVILGCLLCGVILSQNVSAAVNNADIIKKWTFTQYYACAKYGGINSQVIRAYTPEGFFGMSLSDLVATSVFRSDKQVDLPSYGFGHSSGSDEINCRDLFVGGSQIPGAASYAEFYNSRKDVKWSEQARATELLWGLGYAPDTGSNKQVITISGESQLVSLSGDSVTPGGEFSADLVYNGDNGKWSFEINKNYDQAVAMSINGDQFTIRVNAAGGQGVASRTITLSDNPTVTANKIRNELTSATLSGDFYGNYRRFVRFSSISQPVSGTASTYTYNAGKTETAIVNMSGTGMGIRDAKMTFAELYTLYAYYIDKIVPSYSTNRIDCSGTDHTSEGGVWASVKLKDNDGAFKMCQVNFTDVPGWNGIKVKTQWINTDIPWVGDITVGEMIYLLNSFPNEQLGDVATIGEIGLNGGGGDDGGQPTEVTCVNSGAANSLGWILCPVLKLLSDAAQTAYEGLLEPALKIEPQLFNPNENTDAVRNAWGIFQGVANTLFIILLLVVIISQLTGVGIDNYGIKKILPKMILMAIMINLSYVICLICVDLSNILGNGLRAMFDGVNITIPTSMAIENGNFTIGGGTTMLVAAAVLAGAVVSIWAAVKNSNDGGSAILVALVMAALSIVVAIFFLFILLAARQAAVIVLTVLSPVAFACYMLPNTKKIFDRWLKIWWGLLLVYPIAGALIGGGNFVSKVLLAASGNSGFFAAFMAMIAGVAPIFFIPTVLKNSFSALGNLGAKISGMGRTAGNRLSGGAGRAIKNSRGYQDRVKYNKDRQDERRARRIKNQLQGIPRENLNARQRRRLALANDTLREAERRQLGYELGADEQDYQNKLEHQRVAFDNERVKMFEESFASRDRGDIKRELNTALSSHDAEKAVAALSALEQQGGIAEALEELTNADWAGMDSNVRHKITQRMANSNVDAMKSYSKYRSTGGGAGFREWANGSISAAQRAAEAGAGVKDLTYAEHLSELGERSMRGYTKDEMQFVESNANGIRSTLEQQAISSGGTAENGKAKFGQMLSNAAIYSNDAKAQTAAEKIMSQQLATGELRVDDLNITADMIGDMRGETAKAIVDGLESAYTASGGSPLDAKTRAKMFLRSQLATQIAGVNADNRTKNKTNRDVADIFGIT